MAKEEQKIVDTKDIIGPAFHKVHVGVKRNYYDEVWLKGGRGSLKTSTTAIEIVYGIIRDPEANALVLRKVGDTLRGSVNQSLLWAINKLGWDSYFDSTTSPAEITYKLTGQKIIMKGADKPEKLKGLNLAKGYFKYVWYEEVSEFASMAEIRSINQTVLRGGKQQIRFYTFNPPPDEHNWVNKETNIQLPRRLIHHSDYRTVPPEWLGEQFLKEAEQLKERDYDRYRHEYLGEVVGRSDKLVMAGKWEVGDRDTSKMDGAYYGLDFGFANDPNVACKLWVDWDAKEIYVEYAEYGYGTETDNMPSFLKRVPGIQNSTIRADSARPETISYLRRHGFQRIKSVKKWNGSVEEGVNWMRGFRWIFNPRCEKAIEEAKNWSYKVNKAGDILGDLQSGWDHFFDAARYALAPFIKKRNSGEEAIMPYTTGGDRGWGGSRSDIDDAGDARGEVAF